MCARCAARYRAQDRVVYLSEREEDRAVRSERAAVVQTERLPELGGIGAWFDELAAATGGVRDAILALPYGDGSAHYREPGYFANVLRSAPAFDFVVERLDPRAGRRLLDVGADLTWSTARLAAKGFECVAIDINHHLPVAALFQEHVPPYALVNVDMHAPAFADESFDVITAFNALHHSHRLEELTSNLGRMLKPGGRLGFVEPYCLDAEAKARFGAAHIAAGVNENVYLLDEWHRALTDAGMANVTFLLTDSFNALYEKRAEDLPFTDLFADVHRARLTIIRQSANVVNPGGSLDLSVRVVNHGRASWSSDGLLPIFLSYHIRCVDGGEASLVRFDNPRTALPHVVHADDAIELALTIAAPSDPGRYVAEVDLVQEGMCWFAERGVRAPQVEFSVGWRPHS